MLKRIGFILLFLSTLTAFGQSAKYQVGTILKVKSHEPASASGTEAASYEVSVKVKDTVYVVLYTPAIPLETINYVAGREVVVSVGDKTVKYNDLLGQTFELPILSQETNAAVKKAN